MEQFQERREEIVAQKDMHGKADKEFYITASRILELANKAEQKSQLLQFLLQNSTLDGKKVDFTLKKPFDAILTASKTEDWLPNSAVMLYQLFPHDLMEQMRIKLEMLKELLGSESQYETVEVKNGQFCRYTI